MSARWRIVTIMRRECAISNVPRCARIAQHANPDLLFPSIRLSAFPQNVIKRNQHSLGRRARGRVGGAWLGERTDDTETSATAQGDARAGRGIATRRAALYQRIQLCRDARAPLARRPPPRAQPATPNTTRETPPPVPVPACVAACARAHAQCGVRDGEARRLCPPSWPVRESRAQGAPRKRKRGIQ